MSRAVVVAIVATLGFLAPASALARPVVHVGVVAPPVVVSVPAPHVHVRTARPAPEYVWVEGYTTRDRYGRPVYVAGYWAPAPPPPPPPRASVTISTPVLHVRLN